MQVSAAGLHPIVKSLANGTHYGSTGVLPFIPGVDGVGRLEDGSRVYFGISRSPFGSFAERTVATKGICLPLPDGLDDATAAASANPAMSSWAALTVRAKFVAGESVLILGATGVGGKLAVQIAKRLGARRVIAAGRNPAALEELKGLGADAVISLGLDKAALVAAFRKEWVEAGGVDVVLDYLWGAPAEEFAGGDLAEGFAAFDGTDTVCADRVEFGWDDYAAGCGAAEYGSGDAGERVWECFDRADYAGCGGVF